MTTLYESQILTSPILKRIFYINKLEENIKSLIQEYNSELAKYGDLRGLPSEDFNVHGINTKQLILKNSIEKAGQLKRNIDVLVRKLTEWLEEGISEGEYKIFSDNYGKAILNLYK